MLRQRRCKKEAASAAKFKDYVENYGMWITTVINMVIADLPYECYRLVFMQSTKFNKSECSYKWKNLHSSYEHEPKGVNELEKFLRYICIGIDVSIDYSYKMTAGNIDFQFDMFNKNIMIDHSTKIPAVRPEFTITR